MVYWFLLLVFSSFSVWSLEFLLGKQKAGSITAHLYVLIFILVWIAIVLVIVDYRLTVDSIKILAEQGILSSSPEYNAVLYSTKHELIKTTFLGKAFSSFTSKK